MDLRLDGRTALVTGASQGLGRAIAKAPAAEGVKVFATARNPVLLASLVTEVGRDGTNRVRTGFRGRGRPEPDHRRGPVGPRSRRHPREQRRR